MQINSRGQRNCSIQATLGASRYAGDRPLRADLKDMGAEPADEFVPAALSTAGRRQGAVALLSVDARAAAENRGSRAHNSARSATPRGWRR